MTSPFPLLPTPTRLATMDTRRDITMHAATPAATKPSATRPRPALSAGGYAVEAIRWAIPGGILKSTSDVRFVGKMLPPTFAPVLHPVTREPGFRFGPPDAKATACLAIDSTSISIP